MNNVGSSKAFLYEREGRHGVSDPFDNLALMVGKGAFFIDNLSCQRTIE
jgi:hypothetical protein